MYPHYAGIYGQVGSGKIQAHTHVARLGKDGLTLPLIHESCRVALKGPSRSLRGLFPHLHLENGWLPVQVVDPNE